MIYNLYKFRIRCGQFKLNLFILISIRFKMVRKSAIDLVNAILLSEQTGPV